MHIYLGYHIMAAIIAIIIDVHEGSNEVTKPGTADDLTERWRIISIEVHYKAIFFKGNLKKKRNDKWIPLSLKIPVVQHQNLFH